MTSRTRTARTVAPIGLTIGLMTALPAISAPLSVQPVATVTPAVTSWAWGLNNVGMLGDGSALNRPRASMVSTPTGTEFTTLAGGGYHTLALDRAGQAWSWGGNGHGELGNGVTTDSNVPVRVRMPAGVTFTAIAGGGYQSLALDRDGRVWSWGINVWGELGDGTGVNRTTPVRVNLPADVRITAISAGQHGMALDSTGQVWTWGLNHTGGALGDGTMINRYSPVRVIMPSGVRFTAIDAGAQHSLALDTDGRVWSWGCNDHGQLGDGTTGSRTVPGLVRTPAGVRLRTIAGGNWTSWALDTAGTAWSWGSNGGSEIGDGTGTDRYTPVRVAAPTGITFSTITGGGHHVLALDTSGKVWAWGYNGNAQIGDGTTINRATPVRVATPAGIRFTALFTGGRHSLAVGEVEATSTTTLSIPTNPAVAGRPVPMTVTVTCTGGTPQGTVRVLNGSTSMATGTLSGGTGTATLTIADPAPGTYPLTAVYDGDGVCPGSSSAAVVLQVIDRDPPVITAPADQLATATGPAGTPVPWSTQPTAIDQIDGPVAVTCDHRSGESYPAGTTTVTCRATDRSGNTATASFGVKVLYQWQGFLQPIVAPGHDQGDFATFKAGATVPVKFTVRYADGTAVIAPAPVWYTPQRCGPVSRPLDPATCGTPVASGTTYRTDDGIWISNWKTAKDMAGSYWKVTVRLADGTAHEVVIALI